MKKTIQLPWFNTSVIGKASLPWLVKTSLALDYQFCKRNPWSAATKCEFLAKKYLLLLLHASQLRRFQLARSSMKFRGRKTYYESSLGFADYQSVLTRHELLLSYCQLQDNSTFVDVGANVGYFTLLLAEKFPHARKLACEPVEKVFACLRENTKGLENVEIVHTAISNTAGHAFMHTDECNSQTSQLTDELTGEEVVVNTLDAVLKDRNISKVDLLKIDVENFEKHVLQRAVHTLTNTRYLLIEISMVDNDNYTFSELISLLHSETYSFQLLALRNFDNVAEGVIPVGDFLFENVLYGVHEPLPVPERSYAQRS